MNKSLTLCVLLIFTSCIRDDSAEREAYVKKTLQQRIERYTDNKMKECEELALERANEIVDSTFRKNANVIFLDSIDVPPKPARPARDSFKFSSSDSRN